jgi:hypothetical protein
MCVREEDRQHSVRSCSTSLTTDRKIQSTQSKKGGKEKQGYPVQEFKKWPFVSRPTGHGESRSSLEIRKMGKNEKQNDGTAAQTDMTGPIPSPATFLKLCVCVAAGLTPHHHPSHLYTILTPSGISAPTVKSSAGGVDLRSSSRQTSVSTSTQFKPTERCCCYCRRDGWRNIYT